jgi:hypothetical protein
VADNGDIEQRLTLEFCIRGAFFGKREWEGQPIAEQVDNLGTADGVSKCAAAALAKQ